MARLVLKFEDRVIQEYGLGLLVTIGRTPDNVLTIDNPAVSSHHACIFRDGDQFIVEDFQSTNGTFVNEKRIHRHTLQSGDVILVGRHTMVFERDGTGPPLDLDGDDPSLANLGDTVFLDASQHRKLLARLTSAPGPASRSDADDGAAAAGALVGKPALLRVLRGRTDRSEYTLEGRTSLIGKTEAAIVRLRGWFTPAVAVAITRSNDSYIATAIRGKTSINGYPLNGRRELKHGDVLRVRDVSLEFRVGT
jgi:pSer/pThr/pTyr-binding forkhead associated (FHA) protein